MRIRNPVVCRSVHCRIIAFWAVGIAGLWTASVFKDSESRTVNAVVTQVLQEEQGFYFDEEMPVFTNTEDMVTVKKESKTININTAEIDELVLLPGIGLATAQKIVNYRKQKGNFANVQDLKKVSGIGEKKFEALRDFVKL